MASIPASFPAENGQPASQNKNQQPAQPPVNQPSNQPSKTKRNKHKKNHSQSLPQIDGTVSDSVTNPMASPQPKKNNNNNKQRHQSVATGAPPIENGNVGKGNGAKARPVSMGSGILPATPAKEQAYAGPTFQASPAPSSLPVPKFFSRSVPNVAAQQQSLGARMAGEKTPEAERSSPEAEVVAPAPPRDAQLSPLDLFFKADKAEREQSRSASLRSPEMAARRAPPATEPRNAFQQSGKSVFLREMDGDLDMPSPKTVPRNDRPVPPQRSSSSGNASPSQNDGDRDAYTKSLKDLLFNVNATPPPPSPSNGAPRGNSNPRNAESPYQTPSPFQRPTSGPSTPVPLAEQQNHYSLHYGNRNLSPMFKAAQHDTPPRPSSLRQQQLSGELSPTSPTHSRQPPPQLDPDSFSRNYLDQHIRASQPATMPPLPLPNGTSSSVPSAGHGVPATGASPRTGSGSGGQQDIRTMEDDLRPKALVEFLTGWDGCLRRWASAVWV
ncbi:uncharacterized protein LTR77_008482 [Saxophila tyrrhenica]|uniref:Uncharacterized protein n=1 Tax=Saxophila tyrrhenica TaxID=1690608 RepID=A0AAV9P1G7_9PEZI|nr:hypothetical protein LTR77_008482 [Saxophila tyrrhenica]